MKFTPVSFTNKDGEQQSITMSLADYRAAEKQKLTLPQYVNMKYRTDASKYGTTFSQMLASTGMFMSENRDYGIRVPTLAQILEDGVPDINMASVTSPDGSQSDTPAGRLFFPAALLEMIESNLRPNLQSYIGSFMSMVGFTRNVDSPKYEQVIIDYTNPRNARGMPISQLALPTTMITITASQVNKTIPTISIGMEISAEAIKLATLDLVGLAVNEQAINERASRMIADFVALVQGSVDSGDTALVSSPITTYDASIVANGVCTQKAWVKFLRNNWLKRTITDVVCDIDTFLAIQGRTGRPTVLDLSGMDERLNAIPRTNMKGIDDSINFFITDGSPLGANTFVGLDRTKALRRVVYVGASYQAIEEFVLRKGYGMRIDWAERIEQAGYSEAFQLATLTTT
jgi:hypothetical protein